MIMITKIAVIIAINNNINNDNDWKSNNSNASNNHNIKSLSNDNSDKSYDQSYALLTEAFLQFAFYNYQ